MRPKDKYRLLCREHNELPIFFQDWWLDIVCGITRWDVLFVEKGGKVIAMLPYYEIPFLRIIMQPMLTPRNGIWLWYLQGAKPSKQIAFQNKVYSEIAEQLENKRLMYYSQNFNDHFSNWLPFYWRNYQQTTRYTYILDDLSDLDVVWDNMEKERRNTIRKAQRLVEIQKTDDIVSLYNLVRQSFLKQREPVPFSFKLLDQIDQACASRGCRQIYMAVDPDGNLHAALYLIWDHDSAYYLLGGIDPKFGSSGAMSLLIWRAIQDSAKMVKVFDFEGSMLQPIENFFNSFGTVQKPYFNIWKGSLLGKLLFVTYKAFHKGMRYIYTYQKT